MVGLIRVDLKRSHIGETGPGIGMVAMTVVTSIEFQDNQEDETFHNFKYNCHIPT